MVLLLLIFVALVTHELSSVGQSFDITNTRRIQSRDEAIVKDATALAGLFVSINKRLPADIAELEAFSKSAGQPLATRDLEMSFVPNILGTSYRYDRIVFYVQQRRFITDETSFAAGNTCGVGIDDDAGFCAPDGATYAVFDSYDFMLEQLKTLNFRMNETFYKVTQTYDGRTVGFPNKTAAGLTLAANTSVTMAAMVGYTGTAADCRGVFSFYKKHLNCSDLFNEYGGSVMYFYKNSREIFLVTNTPFFTAGGEQVNLSRYARV